MTVPVPVPVTATVSKRDCRVKVAVTLAACVMLTTHAPVPVHSPPAQPANVDDDPLHAPDQLANVKFALGVAVTVTARVVVAAVTIVPALHVMALLRWSVTGMAGLLVGSLWAPYRRRFARADPYSGSTFSKYSPRNWPGASVGSINSTRYVRSGSSNDTSA